MILMAHTKFDFFSLARKTRPYLPDPSYFILSKSWMLIFFYFFLFHDFFTQSDSDPTL